MTKSKLSPTDNTNFENSEVKNTGDDATENPIRQWQCKSCHGFYCPTCKSTIPPKYRPV